MPGRRLAIPLSQREVSDLAALTHHPGYEVLIKIMHLGYQDALDKVAKIDPTEADADKKILASQRIAFATKEFFDLVSNTVDWEVTELVADQDSDNGGSNDRSSSGR